STTGVVTIYAFNFSTKEWYRFLPNITAGNVGIGFSAINNLLTSTSLNTLFLLTNPNEYSLNISGLPVTSSAPAGADLHQPLIIFSAEDLKFMRDISVDAIRVLYNCKPTNSPANLNAIFSINGIDFTQFDSDSCIFDGTWRYVLLYPVSQMFTDKTPQLQIQLNVLAGEPVSMYFGKIVIFGSMDASQRPA